jgi:hypothetical protein
MFELETVKSKLLVQLEGTNEYFQTPDCLKSDLPKFFHIHEKPLKSFARKGLLYVRKEVVASLRKEVKVRGYSRWSIRYGNIIRSIQVESYRKWPYLAGLQIVKDPRLRWFDKGTKNKTGKTVIKPRHFFSNVTQDPAIRERALEIMLESFNDNMY